MSPCINCAPANQLLVSLACISFVLYIVVFSTRGWIGSDTLSLGIWTACYGPGTGEESRCQATQDYVTSGQSDSWVTQTQVVFVFVLISSLISTVCVLGSTLQAFSMVDNPALLFIAVCTSFSAGVLGGVGILVMGLRQAYDDMFRETSLKWSFGVAVVVNAAFFIIAFLAFFRYYTINRDRALVIKRRALAKRQVLENATMSQQGTTRPAARPTTSYTGTGVTHQPRPATVGGTYQRRPREIDRVQPTAPPPDSAWAYEQCNDPPDHNSQENKERGYPMPARDSTTTSPHTSNNITSSYTTNTVLMFQVNTATTKRSPESMPMVEEPDATTPEEEEVEMEDEDFYMKMKRREEYMKRRLLLSATENEHEEMEERSLTPSTPDSGTQGITPRPLMPVGRLPPLQLPNKSKKKKKYKKTCPESTEQRTRNEEEIRGQNRRREDERSGYSEKKREDQEMSGHTVRKREDEDTRNGPSERKRKDEAMKSGHTERDRGDQEMMNAERGREEYELSSVKEQDKAQKRRPKRRTRRDLSHVDELE